MKVLSFDVGIKNLAWCLTEASDMNIRQDLSGNSNVVCWKILDWGVWDLRIDIKDEIYHPEFCCAITSSGKICGRIPMFSDLSGNECLGGYCKTHVRHSNAIHTCEDIKKLTKSGINLLRETAATLGIDIRGLRRQELIHSINDIYRQRCIFKIPTLKNTKKMSLDEIHDRIIQRVTDIHYTADLILIENQPVKMNATMKTIQIILWTSLREKMIRNGILQPKVKFVNASKKLYIRPTNDFPWKFDVLKSTTEEARSRDYAQRKKESIERVSVILKETGQDTHLNWFLKNPKKDDLADCLLMCLWGTCD